MHEVVRRPERVTLGVDTHAEVHVAAALDERGRLLGTCSVATTPAGFAELVRWAEQYGEVAQVGMEGTGSYGARLARWLRARAVTVVEVDRPDRRTRRRPGKSDTVDAEAAARAVQAGTATAPPQAGTGAMEMLRTLRVARQSAVKARTQAANQLHALVVTAPEPLRTRLRRLTVLQLVATAAAFRPTSSLTTPTAATKLALKSIAVRYQQLHAEIASLDRHLDRLVAATGSSLLRLHGIGPVLAAILLGRIGDIHRFPTAGHFAAYCGVAPLEASSGDVVRHRRSRLGDRQLNAALYIMALSQVSSHPLGRAYYLRKQAEGHSKAEALRCLKRHLANIIYRCLRQDAARQTTAAVSGDTEPRRTPIARPPAARNARRNLHHGNRNSSLTNSTSSRSKRGESSSPRVERGGAPRHFGTVG